MESETTIETPEREGGCSPRACSAWRILHSIGIPCSIANVWIADVPPLAAIGLTCYMVLMIPVLVFPQNL